ncbi:MAG: hypothetical protein ACI8Q1_000062 [Parvicella sp.]|jgi:hypothetical protein
MPLKKILLKLLIVGLIVFQIISCDTIQNTKNRTESSFDIKKVDSILPIKDTVITSIKILNKITSPKYPKTGKEFKFITKKDSVHYILILQRTNDSTITFRSDDDLMAKGMHYGIAELNNKLGVNYENSVLTGYKYKTYEFIETLNTISYQIRIGVDSVGSGDRLLVRFIKSYKNDIIFDLNMSN